MRRLLTFALAGSILVGGHVRAQDAGATDSDDDVREAARLCLAQGVACLKQRAQAEPDGWVVGPNRFVRVIGYTNVTVRYAYSQRVIWEPIYSYTNVVTFQQDTVGAPLRKVIQSRIVRQIGSNKVERLVYDPNGSIVKVVEEARPLFEQAGNVHWASQSVGDAALAAYALRKAGVVDADPVMQNLLINLKNHVASFGLPDQTWNLAWLAVVFAGTPGDEAAELARRLAGRLLDGQITDGAARGFWGTISVHHGLLAALLRDYLAMGAELQKKEARLKEKPGKMAQAAVDEITEAMDRLKTLTEHEVCQRGFRFAAVEGGWVIDPHAVPQVMLAGADEMLYNQTAADIESTWAALFALSVAAEQSRLPVETWRPKAVHKPGVTTSPLPPAERAEAVLARAANALAAQQGKDGRWSECNQHQPVTKFDAFKTTLPVPADARSFVPLASPVTALSTAQGMAALDSIGRTVGMRKLLTSFGSAYSAGKTVAAKETGARLAAVWSAPTARPQFKWDDYALLLTLSRPLKGLDEAGAAPPDTEKLVRAVALASSPTGSWGKGLFALAVPSSVRARSEALKEKHSELQMAHLSAVHYLHHNYLSPGLRDAEGLCTAVAVIFLAGYVGNPADVLADLSGNDKLPALWQESVTRLTVVKPSIKTAPVAVDTLVPTETSDVPAAPAVATNAPPKADETF